MFQMAMLIDISDDDLGDGEENSPNCDSDLGELNEFVITNNDETCDNDNDSDNDSEILGTVSQIGENCGDDSDRDAGDLSNSDYNDSDSDLESDINQYSDSDNDRSIDCVNNTSHGDSDERGETDTTNKTAKHYRDKHKKRKAKSLLKRQKAFHNWQTRKYNEVMELLRNDDIHHFKHIWNDLCEMKRMNALKSETTDSTLRLEKGGSFLSIYATEGEFLKCRKQETPPDTTHWRGWFAQWPELRRLKTKYTISEQNFILEVAAKHGSRQCLQFLLDLGYDPNVYRFDISNRYEKYGLPLNQAVKNEHTCCVDILLEAGSLVNLPGCDGITPLHTACELGNIDIIKLLLRTPDILPYIGDVEGNNPICRMLYMAEDNLTSFSQIQKVMTTMKNEGCRPWIRNSRGEPPLHVFVTSRAVCDDIESENEAEGNAESMCTFRVMQNILQKLTDSVPDLDMRCGCNGRVRRQKQTRSCDAISCNCCFYLSWDHLQQGETALAACASFKDPTCNNSALCLLQANADHSARCLIVNQHLVYRHEKMDELSRHVFQTLTSTTLPPSGVSDDVLSLFEIGLLEKNYVFVWLLVEAGHFVPYTVSFDEYEPFISEEEENQSLISLLQLLHGGYSLQWWCRRVIRKCLPKGYMTFRSALDTMPIPSGIKDFLCLDNLHVKDLINL